MEFSSTNTPNYWPKIVFSVISSIFVVLWLQYPAQVLFWFFAIDIFIVSFYTLIQLLRFSSNNKYLLLIGGVAVSCVLIPLVLGSFAILVTQNIIRMDVLMTEHMLLAVPILSSLVAYFYITQSSQFTTRYFDRYKVRVFLFFTFGTLFLGSWITYSTYLFGEAFATHYVLGFIAYLLYKLVFDALVYHFFARYRSSRSFILKN